MKYSPNTRNAYKIGILSLILCCKKAAGDILTQDIKEWMNNLTLNGISKNSIRVKLAGIRAFFKFLLEENVITSDPSNSALLKITNVRPKKRKRLTDDQIFYMRDALKSNVKNRTIFEILFSTAIRVSELVNIKIEDVLLGEDLIIIKVSKRKRQRFVFLSYECRVSLAKYMKMMVENKTNPHLFPGKNDKPITRQGVWKMLNKYSHSIDVTFNSSPHRIRRTTGYKLLKEGMDYEYVMWILGHKNPVSTQVYIEEDDED